MFLDSPAQAGLLIAAVLSFVGYWLIWAPRTEVSLTGAVVKTISTGSLALAVVLGNEPIWLALGLAFGALGDFLLARRGERAFLAGMAAFALGHLVYAWGLMTLGAQIAIAPFNLSAPQIFAALCLVGVVVSTEVWLAPRTGALRWPVRGYVLVIGLMGLAALTLPAHPMSPSAAVIRLGAGLFILSDLLLSFRLFVVKGEPAQRRLSLVLWPAYWCAQALILVGVVAYAAPFGT